MDDKNKNSYDDEDNNKNSMHDMERNSNGNSHNDNLDNWLPITACREAKWWYITFHNVTTMVGAAVLCLPFAVAQLGWESGILSMFVSWLVTFYTLWQLVNLHEVAPGRRFDRYPDLGKYAFKSNFGYWFIMCQQVAVQVAFDIVYMVTAGKSLKKSCELCNPRFKDIQQPYFILFFAICELLLSQLPNFNSLKIVSVLAALMSVGYSGSASIASLIWGIKHKGPISYGPRSKSPQGIMFDAFNGLGTVSSAFAGHSVALEIQATIPSTPGNPSKITMWRGVSFSYCIVAGCYFLVAISGYWAFGSVVEDDVLISLEKPNWLIAAANLMVFIHVAGSYQVFAMPVFDKIESTLVRKCNFKPGRFLRLWARSIYVILTALVGVCLPFFGGLLGFFGGFLFTCTSYIMPSLIWLAIHKPKIGSFHWIASWTCVIVGFCLTVVASVGGLRQIIISYDTYKIFS